MIFDQNSANPPDDASDKIVFDYLTASRGRAAVTGAMWSALNTLIPTALSALVFIVTSRYLLPKDFGLVALATSVVMFASGVGPTAFGEALIQQQRIRQSHLDSVFWLALISATAIYLVVVAISPVFAAFFGQDGIVKLIAIIGLKIIFDMIAIVPNALINRSMAFHIATFRTAVATVISSAVCLVLILTGFGIWAIALAQIVSSVSSCVAAFWGAGWLPGFRFKLTRLRDLAHYGVFASANRFLQTMNLDQLIIGTLVSPEALGIYNFAKRLLQMLNDVVAGGLTSVSHVLLSSLQDEQARVRDAFMMATFGCSLVSFPAFLGLAAVASDAIPLIFGTHWEIALWPVRFFCVIGVMTGIGVIQASLITSQGKAQWWFYYQLVRNLVTVLTVLALYRAGISSIVFAIMVGTLLFWPITLVMASRLIGLSVAAYFKQFIRPLIVAMAMLASVVLVQHLMPHQDFWRLAVSIVVGGLVYVVAIYLLCHARIMSLWHILKAKRAAA